MRVVSSYVTRSISYYGRLEFLYGMVGGGVLGLMAGELANASLHNPLETDCTLAKEFYHHSCRSLGFECGVISGLFLPVAPLLIPWYVTRVSVPDWKALQHYCNELGKRCDKVGQRQK